MPKVRVYLDIHEGVNFTDEERKEIPSVAFTIFLTKKEFESIDFEMSDPNAEFLRIGKHLFSIKHIVSIIVLEEKNAKPKIIV